MEREANYAAVGVFVLLVLVMGGLFVYWYSDGRDHREYQRYEIYFDGSVTGLSAGGAVRYLGVDVGRIWRIRLDRRAADRVQVLVDVDLTAPVSADTLAQLSMQGVTGLLYIDLLQKSHTDPSRRVLEVPSENYPVIRSVRSDFDEFVSSLPDLVTRVGELVARTSQLLSEDNLASVQHVVTSLDRASAQLPATMQNFGQLAAELRTTTGAARALIGDLGNTARNAAPDLEAAISRLRASADHMATASDSLDKLLGDNRAGVQSFVQGGLPQAEALLRESRATAEELRQLARSLRSDPSRLLYQPAPAGVEIPR